MTYAEDMRDEAHAHYEDAVHEDILAAIDGDQGRAELLAVSVLGAADYLEWRSEFYLATGERDATGAILFEVLPSFDVPTVAELLAIVLDGSDLEEVAKLVGLDYEAQAAEAMRDCLASEQPTTAEVERERLNWWPPARE